MAEIVIDLKNSSNAKYFEGNLIHQGEYEQVEAWITDQLERAANPTTERLHETITILGTRGSGKSTFLYSILHNYPKKYPGIVSLRIVDPTLIEEKGHVFLDIISRIKDLVDDQLDLLEVDQVDNNYLLKKKWQDLVKSLAYGLPLLDGVGGQMTENSWQDPEFIMSNGIRAISAARKLEDNFHLFVATALSILKKEAFLIAFDDIDIDFKRGWRVIETIRKYFTTPKIITLLTGDLKLYSKAIRKQQWENFGKALIDNEGEKMKSMTDFNDLVTEMEGQYMQKVMKPERRVHLTTIFEKLSLYGENYVIKVKGGDGQVAKIADYYDRILDSFGIHNTFLAEPYRAFLMGMPLRAQIQFLSSVDQMSSYTLRYNRGISDSNVMDAFASDLMEKKVDISMAAGSSKFLNIIILRLLLNSDLLQEAYQLQPTTDDISLNSSMTALTFLYSQKVRRTPFLIFEYLIKIGYLRNISDSFGYINNRTSGALSLRGLINHTGLLQDRVLRDVTGSMTAYIRANLMRSRTNKSPWGGTIPLPGLAGPQNRGNELLRDRIDRVFDTQPGRTIAYFPLSVAQYPLRNDTQLVFSVYGLLATIGELTREGLNIVKGILEYSQLRSYPMPQSDTDFNARETENFTGDWREYPGGSQGLEDLETALTDWKNSYDGVNVAPYLLGKISTRFHFALTNIESNEVTDNLGDMFHNRIVAFMNAVLIEDIKEKNSDMFRNIHLGNTNYSDRIFTDNLHTVVNRKDKNLINLSEWLLTCPLLLVYLKKELIDEIDELFDISYLEQVNRLNIYQKMKEVIIDKGEPKTKVRIFKGTDKMINLFEEVSRSKIPFEWFGMSDDKKVITNYNSQITKRLPLLFPNSRGQASGLIRNLRRFIAANNIKSW